jgi:hypothetical protein
VSDAVLEVVPEANGPRYWDVLDAVQAVVVGALRPVAAQHRETERTTTRYKRRLSEANARIKRLRSGGKR